MVEEKETRATAPGIKRLALVLSALAYILLGLPLWWKLTEVYRAPLPYRQVGGFAGRASSPRLPCQLQIVFLSKEELDGSEWRHRLEAVLDAIRELQNGSGISCELEVSATLDSNGECLRKRGSGDDDRDADRDQAKSFWECGRAASILDAADEDERFKELLGQDSAGKYTVLVLLGDGGVVKPRFGRFRHAWFQFPISDLLAGDELLIGTVAEIATALLTGGRSAATAMPLAADGSAVLSFSLLNADPESWTFNWDFDGVESQYLAPIVDALAPVARLSVESQILYYTPAAANSRWDSDARSHVLDSKDLAFFVNANEWHLDTSTAAAGRSKILHFAIYVPPRRQCPLRIKMSSGRITSAPAIDGFTSPGWGGVVVLNPPGCLVPEIGTLDVNDLKTTMEVVVAQLRTLLGLPPSPARRKDGGVFDPRTGFAEWEVDALLRRRVIADVNSTAATLTSLLSLVESLPKMVIQEEIGDQVQTSLAAAEKAIDCSDASYGAIGNLLATARARAEAAFFHPSIMSLLHFPKEHQFAVYTPFFVPVVLHTAISVVKETMRYARESRKWKCQIKN